MEEKILGVIQDCLKEKKIEVKGDLPAAELLDSITFVKMVVALETELDFEFEDEMLAVGKFETIGDIVEYVKGCVSDN